MAQRFQIVHCASRVVVLGDPYLIDKDYIQGSSTPHYPVPAIPEHVSIWHDMVLWSRDHYPMQSGYLSRRINRDAS